MEAYKTNPHKDESAIARLLTEVSLTMPDPAVIKLSSEINTVLDTYGTTVTDPATPKNLQSIITPPVIERDFNGFTFGFGLKKHTNHGSAQNPDLSTLELFARGADGSTTTCAVIKGGELSVKPPKNSDVSRINEPNDIAFVSAIVHEISNKLDFEASRRKAARLHRLEMSRRTLLKGFAISSGIAALGGAGLGLSRVDWDEFFKSKSSKFDEMKLMLSGGAVAMIGQTVTPEFSSELISRPELAGDNIPILTHVSRGKTSSPDDFLSMGDGLRQIRLNWGFGHFWPWEADRPETGSIKFAQPLPDDAKLRVWTSLRSPSGESRADELRVSFLSDRIDYKWSGKQIDGETARIVVLVEK